MTSVLPGMLVQSLVTVVTSNGLNLQILGFFDATVDEYHQSLGQKAPKVGQKVKARVLYNISGTSPPQYAVTLRDHHLALRVKSPTDDPTESSMMDAFPLGTTLGSDSPACRARTGPTHGSPALAGRFCACEPSYSIFSFA